MLTAEPDKPTDAAGFPSAALTFMPTVLKERSDFLRLARARRVVTDGFVLQGRRREDGPGIRVGYTCSKKVGNAVARNRAKRRLREIARQGLAQDGQGGWDYVLIGRHKMTATLPFDVLKEDFGRALRKLHGK
ncbi:ribonuclease P protein component [Aestuariibius insulae]|uniref:ribonuclease P protein component n=1 Tax=Aestuariibius insulae TaxID=2058287 RepID=UPI00398ECE9C